MRRLQQRRGSTENRALWVASALVFLLVSALLAIALTSVAREEQTRQSVVAERVFDELERTLAARVETEDARPFFHYNHEFPVDNDVGLLAQKRSPIASAPPNGLVGYFQRAPDGDLTNPYRDASGSPSWKGVDATEEELAVALGAPPQQQEVVQQAQSSSLPILQQLNKGLRSHKARAPRNQEANTFQVGNYLGNLEPGTVLQGAEVPVGPFEVQVTNVHLVFKRRVQIDGSPWEQGFVARKADYLQQVELSALEGVEGAALHWGPGGTWTHQFAAPFDGLQASLTLAPLPGPPIRTALVALALALLLVLAASGILVRRWMAESARMARQRTDFVAAVTHELRTPLTSIRMYAEMLEQGMAPPQAREAYLGTIRGEAERLGTLVEGVLAFAKLERGEREDSAGADLQKVVQEVVRVLTPIAAEQQVQITTDIVSVPVPRGPMTQVLHNLIDNAIKFAEHPKQVRITATVDGDLVLTVHNTGPPLPEDLRSTMFDPFIRGGSELTRETRGTGIGLAVVRGLVEERGGSVRSRNTGTGVELRVQLPI